MDICVRIKDNFINLIDNAESGAILIGIIRSLDSMRPFFVENDYEYKFFELGERATKRAIELNR